MLRTRCDSIHELMVICLMSLGGTRQGRKPPTPTPTPTAFRNRRRPELGKGEDKMFVQDAVFAPQIRGTRWSSPQHTATARAYYSAGQMSTTFGRKEVI